MSFFPFVGPWKLKILFCNIARARIHCIGSYGFVGSKNLAEFLQNIPQDNFQGLGDKSQ